MIPRIHGRGFSFKGITDYLMHDKEARTSERVTWSRTENMRTSDVEKAAKVMAWTDLHREDIRLANGGSAAGMKPEKGRVHHCVLAWAVGEDPGEDHQWETVQAYMAHQGMDHLQYYAVSHNDTNHIHVHIVSNLVDPLTGKIHEVGFEKHHAQKWALGYERDHELHCHMREVHAAMREQEGAKGYYKDKKTRYGIQITRAYEASDNGKSFINALALEGFTLAKGRKSYVAVENNGDIINLSRVIDGHKTTDIKAKLGDLGREKLPDADALSEDLKARHAQALADREKERQQAKADDHEQQKKPKAKPQDEQPEIWDRDAAALESLKRMEDAAIEKAKAQARAEREAKRAKKAKPRSAKQREKATPPPLYETIDRDRERVGAANSKRLAEIENIKASCNLDRHRDALAEANRALAGKQGFWSWILGHQREAENHAQAMRLTYENAKMRQQEAIAAINRKYGYSAPETQRSGAKPEEVPLAKEYERAAAKPEQTRLAKDYEQAAPPQRTEDQKPEDQSKRATLKMRDDFAQKQGAVPASQPPPELGKMREEKDMREAVKKQGWQEPDKDDPFSGLRPELQGEAREAYRQAKAAEIKRTEEGEGLGRKRRPRIDHD